MSQFSDRLKILLDESGTSVYQLSRNAKLDRTTIQRALTGERLPGASFVERLCDFLRVSPAERAELLELHTITRVGEKVYAARRYIKDMIERMAAVHIKSQNIVISRRTIEIEDQIKDGFKTFSGQYNVQNLVRDVLEDEAFNGASPHIYLTVPFENTFLFDLLYNLFLSCGSPDSAGDSSRRLLVRHIIKLSKNPLALQDSNYNLNVLSNVLPFAFCEYGSYQPYYYYGNVEASKDIDTVFPYYILTGKYLIQLSSDFNTAVLCGRSEIFDIYNSNFEKSLLQAGALVTQHSLCEEMLTTYINAMVDAGQFTHVIEPQPCFAKYYTTQLIEDKLRKDIENREFLKLLLTKLYGNYQNVDRVPMSLFSIEGIKQLARTGMLADLPPQYAVPFTVEERRMLLKQLKNDIVEDTYFVRAADSLKFAISPLASVQLYGSNAFMICTINSSGMMSTSFISEKSICESFFDFFESLYESDLLYSKEETIRILDEVIDGLDGKL